MGISRQEHTQHTEWQRLDAATQKPKPWRNADFFVKGRAAEEKDLGVVRFHDSEL